MTLKCPSNHSQSSFGRHLSAGPHRTRLHLADAGPLPDEVPEPLVLGARLGRLGRLRSGGLGAGSRGQDTCAKHVDQRFHGISCGWRMENCCAVNLQWRFRAVNARLPRGKPLLRIETSVFGEATVAPQLGCEHLE